MYVFALLVVSLTLSTLNLHAEHSTSDPVSRDSVISTCKLKPTHWLTYSGKSTKFSPVLTGHCNLEIISSPISGSARVSGKEILFEDTYSPTDKSHYISGTKKDKHIGAVWYRDRISGQKGVALLVNQNEAVVHTSLAEAQASPVEEDQCTWESEIKCHQVNAVVPGGAYCNWQMTRLPNLPHWAFYRRKWSGGGLSAGAAVGYFQISNRWSKTLPCNFWAAKSDRAEARIAWVGASVNVGIGIGGGVKTSSIGSFDNEDWGVSWAPAGLGPSILLAIDIQRGQISVEETTGIFERQ